MITRGHIYRVNLHPTKGREQTGDRPVLVVSVDALNRQPLVVTVVPGTDAKRLSRDFQTNVRVPAHQAGLSADTVFRCFQVRALDPSRLVNPATHPAEPVGVMPPHWMREIEHALRLVLGL